MNDREQQVCQWARERIQARDFIVLDTETSGIDDRAEIVQIVIVNAWHKIAFSSLVRPLEPIDESGKAFVVNGISNAMVERAPPFKAVWPLLLEHVGQARIVAYNADFNFRMVWQNCERHKLVWPFPEFWDCAMLRYSEFVGEPGKYGGYKCHKLQEACAQMGCRLDRDRHEAGADALATYDLICALAGKCEADR